MIPNLFTKFNRLDEDKDTDIEGTGLGLAITKSLVELLDGTIGVESTYGVGSTFTVTVPQKIKEAIPETSTDNIEIKIAEVTPEEVKEVEEKAEVKEDVTPVAEEVNVPKVNEMPEEVKEEVVEEKKEIPQVNEMPEEVKEEVVEEKKEIPQVNEMPEEVKDKEPETETIVEAPQQVNNTDDNSENGRLLLVVDDNKVNLKVASRMLEDFNFHIDTAHSGFEAIDKIKNHKKYDLIFMDIMMPDMNGVETMQKLKAMDGFNTPIIALTADAMDGSREKYLAVGFNEYVSKPIIKQVLQEVLGKYVDVDDINIVKDTDDLSKN